MSSHPHGIRYSFTNTTPSQTNQTMIKQQQVPQQQTPVKPGNQGNVGKPVPSYAAPDSLSGSDTDVSTSNENLSKEERYVLKHTSRVEPQGEENMTGSVTPVNEIQGRYIPDKFSSNTSTDSTRYATSNSNRSMSEARNPTLYANVSVGQTDSNRSSVVVSNSNRNSLKEVNSNRSSMDVSQSSYNTLIIHDEGLFSMNNREYNSPPPYMKKERPRSYGEAAQQMAELSEIDEEYLNQSQVLKHLAKEVKLPNRNRSDDSNNTRDSGGASENTIDSREPPKYGHPPKYGQWTVGESTSTEETTSSSQNINKLKSKSQPDLTKLCDIEMEDVEAIVKENTLLKQQLNSCYMKVAKSQKLEQEIANIYRVHEELVQSCERREKLERAARTRLQSDCRRLQELNRAFRDQVEVLQNQVLASSDHQIGRSQQDILISQLVTQNKELADANKRQYIEIQAQSATLEEQRIHINVLDTALKRLEEECRQKQIYVERCAQLQHALQSLQNASERREQAERKLRIDYDSELCKDSNRSGSSNSETNNLKWQLREKENQIIRLEAECAQLEQRNLEETNVRNVAKLAMERNSQETERIIADAKQEKIRYLDEAHAANRKVTELQTRLKLVENRLAEKESMIRALQGQKIYGSTNSYGSYNLSTDSFALLNPISYNSQGSYDNSFDTTTTTSLLDPSTYGQNVSSSFASNYGQTTAVTSYSSPSSSSNFSANYAYNQPTYTSSDVVFQNLNGSRTIYDSQAFDAQRKSIDDQLKQLDEQLLSKRGLCCFPGLTTKKPIQPLLSNDEVSVLSTNNSDAFLQNLAAQIDQRERERQERREQESLGHTTKPEEMVLLEKQGRCSQKLRSQISIPERNNQLSNLAHVSHTVGHNMSDISNIGNITSIAKDRGASLPPSALPRPPRSLKPPRKMEYGRLSDTEMKKRAETPPQTDAKTDYELKTSSLKRAPYGKREFSPTKSYIEMKETLQFTNDFNIKTKNYGSIGETSLMTNNNSQKNEAKFGFSSKNSSDSDFSKPDYTSTKSYQRLEDPSPKSSQDSTNAAIKRSLLPNVRKITPQKMQPPPLGPKGSRDSVNSASSSSNNSNTNSRASPLHSKIDSHSSNMTYHPINHTRTPPKFIPLHQTIMSPTTQDSTNKPFFNKLSPKILAAAHQQVKMSALPPSSSILHAAVQSSATSAIGQNSTASLPPKPTDSSKSSARRGSSLARGENKYRIQF